MVVRPSHATGSSRCTSPPTNAPTADKESPHAHHRRRTTRHRHPHSRRRCDQVVALGAIGDHRDLLALADDTDTTLPHLELREDDDALILYTSGTTGKPKGALFDHHRILWVGVNTIATCGMRAGDRFLHVAPLFTPPSCA